MLEQQLTEMDNGRLQSLGRFYSIMDELERIVGDARMLANCRGRMAWPSQRRLLLSRSRENRSHSGEGPRIVSGGTHALKTASKTKLWKRLSVHKGTGTGGGKTSSRA
jgi:hypothetical protein